MNELITIKNVRGYINQDGTAFLNLEDVARGLGFEREKNGKMYIMWDRVNKYLEEFSFHTSVENDFSPQVGKESFIPENIFYKLCMKANNETARKFQDLVCDEILPEIRKNGGYIVTNDEDDETTIMAKAVLVAQKAIKRLEKKVDILKRDNQIKDQQIAEFKPIKDYIDTILSSPNALAISQIAADYGMTGAELNKTLHEKGVIKKIGGQWLLCKKYLGKGYTQSKTYSYKTVLGFDRTVIATYWTQKGRLKIHEILTSLGIQANQDKENVINS